MKKQLENGLILQNLSENFERDKDRLPEFYFYAFEESDTPETNWLVAWVRDLINVHPLMSPEDFFYVVDPDADNKIVSGTLLIPQTWRYAGIEFPIGRPEIVATLPEYRRKGLVRETFKAVHARSEVSGHIAQFITGIPNYYRQYGYAMAVPFGNQGRIPYTAIEKLKEDESPRFALRKATVADIPTLMEIDRYSSRAPLLTTVRDETLWRYDVGDIRKSEKELKFYVIENTSRIAVGYIAIGPVFDTHKNLVVRYLVLNEHANYIEVYKELLRPLMDYGKTINENIDFVSFSVALHPTLRLLLERHNGASFVDTSEAYAYYMRVPDIPRFLHHIAPVLEARLRGSGAHRYTGTLVIDFFQVECLMIEIDSGKIKSVGYGEKPKNPDVQLSIAQDLFLHLLFGYQSFDEISAYRADVYATSIMRALVDILFPKRHSLILPIS